MIWGKKVFSVHKAPLKKAPPGQAPTSLGKQLQSLLPVCHLSFLFNLIRSVIWEWEEFKMKRQMLGSRSGLTSMQQNKGVSFWSNNVLWSRLFKITDWYFSFLIKEKGNKVTFQHRESRETSLIVSTVILDFSSSLWEEMFLADKTKTVWIYKPLGPTGQIREGAFCSHQGQFLQKYLTPFVPQSITGGKTGTYQHPLLVSACPPVPPPSSTEALCFSWKYTVGRGLK